MKIVFVNLDKTDRRIGKELGINSTEVARIKRHLPQDDTHGRRSPPPRR